MMPERKVDVKLTVPKARYWEGFLRLRSDVGMYSIFSETHDPYFTCPHTTQNKQISHFAASYHELIQLKQLSFYFFPPLKTFFLSLYSFVTPNFSF
ncbi:hypothetical protein VNO77_39610 [Canavalia gladiata]|uniref:Uncharacterized protein n=1 Tax=Canavalia gladiata TaxID=3824 RepID=A0AAN9JZ34_CANGL